jgi:membrane associated rhomboid family serine protease
LCLVIGAVIGLAGAFAVTRDLWELGMLLVGAGIVTFLAGWVSLGVAAIRLDRTSALNPA